MSRRNTTLEIGKFRSAQPFAGTPDGHVDSSVWIVLDTDGNERNQKYREAIADRQNAPINVSPASRKGLGPIDIGEAQRLIKKAELLAKRKRFKPRGMTQEAWEEAEALFKAKSDKPYDPTEGMPTVPEKKREPRETFRRWGSIPKAKSKKAKVHTTADDVKIVFGTPSRTNRHKTFDKIPRLAADKG